ncbi:MAG: Do family serine endopeptidase [Blastocatellia bacterium]
MQHLVNHTSPQKDELIERYRRSRQRAILIAVAACFLAIGVVTGVLLTHQTRQAKAGDKEVTSAFVEIARQVEPAVVNVSTVIQPASRGRIPNEFPIPRPSLEGISPNTSEPAQRGNGSGVIVDTQGYVLTNHHVIAGATRIKVKLYDGVELPAKLVGSDRETDLAVLKVEPAVRLTAARFGNSDKTRVGDWVLAIGSPFGFDQTVTAGIISARERESAELYHKVGFQYFLQTDAAINRGNSGGPLIDLSGEVIGINSLIATSTGDYNGIGFALPSSEAISIYKQLVKQGRVIRGFLGAMTDRVTPQIAKVYGLARPRGALVSNINETMEMDGAVVETPAAKAGLKPNDIILEFGGESIKDDAELVRRVASTPVGASAPMKVFRDGKELVLTVVIRRRPGGEPAKPAEVVMRAPEDESQKTPGIGMHIQALNPQRIREKDLEVKQGVVVLRVDPGSVADDARVRPSDIIEAINREPVKSNDDFKRVLAQLKSGDPIVLQVYRERLMPTPRIFISFNKP